MNCLHCGAPTAGLALCELAMRKVRIDLEFLPVYFRNLARWKPGRAGSRPVPGSREPASIGSGGDDRVIRALDETGNALTTWARKLEDDRGITAPSMGADPNEVADLCNWLTDHLITIATLDWCAEFVSDYADDKGNHHDGIGYHERVLREMTERVAPGWYAGSCRRCEAPTHVVPGLTWVTCGGCGATTYARDHLDVVLDEARGWVARPMRIAEAIVALIDTEMSVPKLHKRISKWGERGQLVSHRLTDGDGDEVGPRRYWFGEVLDRLLAEGATRLDSSTGDVARVS